METRSYLIGFFLSRASLAMKQYVNRLLKTAGMEDVSMGFIGVLLSLYRADGQTISELGESVSLEKSTMTGLIDRMVRANLVGREADPADRRVLRVWLTDRGKAVQPGVGKVLGQAYTDLTSGMADKEVERVERILGHIIDNSSR
jgi:MarR family transcriptional regulator, organic hydroperoxide resistance regulator